MNTEAARNPARGAATLLRWLRHAQFRTQPGRTLASVAAVAIGVALALAIHLVNASALDSFRHAIATVNGDADAQIRAPQGLLDEGVLDVVAAINGVAVASPVLELELYPISEGASPQAGGTAQRPLELVAIDLFSAARVTPALLPAAADQPSSSPSTSSSSGSASGAAGSRSGSASALFDPTSIFLSDAAAATHPAASLLLREGRRTIRLDVAGRVPGAAAGQSLAVMDLGSAQWAFDAVGKLSRIDIKLAAGAALQSTLDRLQATLPDGTQLITPQASEQRMSNLSRAYRVNLNVLALVALLTGGFIVFATMSLAAVRQQQEMALLMVLGAPPATATRALLWQGALVGVWGSALGVAGGIALAYLLLNTVGGDLGGGYFNSAVEPLVARPWSLIGFGLLGCLTAVLGSLAPARAARRLPAAQVLKSGSQEATLRRFRPLRSAAILAAAAAGLMLAPPILGLPLGAYLAIAALLFAGISLVPPVIEVLLGGLRRSFATGLWRRPVAWLAVTRQAQAPASVAIALAGVVASFALTCAMVIMVSSFRLSVDDWLDKVLPADLYARAPSALQGSIDPQAQRAIVAIPGVERVHFLRSIELLPNPQLASVLLIARSLGGAPVAQQLPLTGPALRPPAGSGAVPVYVSEAMVSLHGFAPGSTQQIALAGQMRPVFVAGVWRDYARQTGAITMDLADYRRLTGDATVSDVGVWLADGASADSVIEQIRRAAPVFASTPFRSAGEIRALSLEIFDRSFAVTYVLEAVAIIVGLFGVASTYAAEALNRAREFGMMRHLGVSRRMLVRQLAIESTIGTSIALAWGGLLGTLIGVILIKRVNPQSFHWTMDLALPLHVLVPSALAVLATAVAAAVLATRSASSGAPLQAVRQDW